MASQHETKGKTKQGAGSNKVLLWKKNLESPVPRFWSDIDATAIRLCIDAVTRDGGAIMFGVTSDGGAYSICVLHGQEKLKEYPHSVEECEHLLAEITGTFVDDFA